MDYGEFKTAFLESLKASRIPTIGLQPGEELLDLRSAERRLSVYLEPFDRDGARPFHVSGSISFRWGALETARGQTCEEDFLRQLFGRQSLAGLRTEPSLVRIDLKVRAGLEWGKGIPMPDASTWARWIHEAIGRLSDIERLVTEDALEETDEGLVIRGWQGHPEARVVCSASGELLLEEVRVNAFELVSVPRRYDDPERDDLEPDPRAQLDAIFKRFKAALQAWGELMDHFRPPAG